MQVKKKKKLKLRHFNMTFAYKNLLLLPIRDINPLLP